jgi:hypothetical protein
LMSVTTHPWHRALHLSLAIKLSWIPAGTSLPANNPESPRFVQLHLIYPAY